MFMLHLLLAALSFGGEAACYGDGLFAAENWPFCQAQKESRERCMFKPCPKELTPSPQNHHGP